MPELIEVTCNHRVNPIGVGANPVFAWKLKGAARQQSYRIFVWEGKNAAWDSGEILSNDTCGIEYGGTPGGANRNNRLGAAQTGRKRRFGAAGDRREQRGRRAAGERGADV